jgi:integrase
MGVMGICTKPLARRTLPRLRDGLVLNLPGWSEPEQAFQIVECLPLFERTLLIVVAVTALRISEALGLRWSDIDWTKLLIHVRRAWKYGKLGEPKSKASKHPVQMHEVLAATLQSWRRETPYAGEEDFVFASARAHGTQPRLGGMIAQDYLRVHAVRLEIIAKDCPRFGFHNFRHSLATFLVENGTDPVVVQRMLRQSNVDTTMIYIHNAKKAREAQGQFMNRFMPSGVKSGVSKDDNGRN